MSHRVSCALQVGALKVMNMSCSVVKTDLRNSIPKSAIAAVCRIT